MRFYINSLVLVCLLSLVSVSFAQEPAIAPNEPAVSTPNEPVLQAPEVDKPAMPAFPYVAEITGDNVYVRSGPGTHHYHCSRLNKGDKVKVVGSKFKIWSRIAPPQGSFSWILAQHVNVDPDTPTVGLVATDNARVWVGSVDFMPIHSTKSLVTLNSGEKVKIEGPKQGDYYKIASPPGTYLWVLTQYTKYLAGLAEPVIEAGQEDPAETQLTPRIMPAAEAECLNQYYVLKNKLDAERVKPIAGMDYKVLRKALTEIADNKEAGKAARYSQLALKQLERYELAINATKAVQLQDEQLAKSREKIAKAHNARLETHQNTSNYIVMGRFQTSTIYSADPLIKYYLLIDSSGKIICYAIPADSTVKVDLARLINKKVGLVGTVEPHQQTKSAIVRFTEVVLLR